MDPSSPEAAGVATGHLLFYVTVIGLGIFFSLRLARKKEGKTFVVWPVVVALVLVALSIFGQSQH